MPSERIRRARLYCLVAEPATARAALAGGADVIQLRDKGATDRELLAAAREVAQACRAVGALSIVNDRADIALAAGADGVHLGQEDLPVAAARQLLGAGPLIGVSTHSDAEIARALADGADYLGIGCCFPSATKAVPQQEGLALVERWAPRLTVPFFPLGGVTPERVPELLARGAVAVAVSGAVCDAPDPEAAARRLVALLG